MGSDNVEGIGRMTVIGERQLAATLLSVLE